MAPTTTISLSTQTETLYFGFGSNLWLSQMSLRCPTSTYLGVARLSNYRWIINARGYANVTSTPKPSTSSIGLECYESHSEDGKGTKQQRDEVYGLVYSLLPTDEANLDRNEGVPEAYSKETLSCEFWESRPEVNDGRVNVSEKPVRMDMLVYVDRKRVEESSPKKEYVYRMNMGIRDALKMGVPKEYVERVMRRFIPNEEGKGTEELALKQALNFVDEN